MSTATRLVSGVDFIGLPTRDLARAVEFYGQTLGLPCSAHRPERHHAEFETGNLTINVMNAEQMGLEHHTFSNPLALHVDGVAGRVRSWSSVESSSTGRRLTPACVTWRSSATRTGTH